MKYRLHRHSGKGFVEIDGKRCYLPGKYGSAESLEAYEKLSKVKLDLTPVAKTIGGLVVKYLDHCKVYYPNQKRGQYKNVRACMKRLLEIHKAEPINEYGPLKLRDFLRHLVAHGASRQYANKCGSLVKRMFKWAASEEIVTPDVYAAVNLCQPLRLGVGEETTPKRPVAWKDVRLVIREAHPMLAAMIKIQWLVGCRPGEICMLNVRDIDKREDVWEWSPARHKNSWRGKKLKYYLGPLAQKILEPWMGGAIEGYPFSPKRLHKKYSVNYNNVSYRNAIKRLTEKLGIVNWSPHQIRHSKGTRMRSLFGVEASRLTLGLSSLDTAEIYAEASERQLKKIAKRF